MSDFDPRRAARSSAFGTPSSRVDRRQSRLDAIVWGRDRRSLSPMHDSAIRADELNTSNERDQRALQRHQRALQRDQSTM